MDFKLIMVKEHFILGTHYLSQHFNHINQIREKLRRPYLNYYDNY